MHIAEERLRSNAAVLIGLLLLGVALPCLMGLSAGSLGIPRNDDWVYRRIAMDLATTGSLTLHSVTTMLVGQIALVQPLLWLSELQAWAFTIAGVLFAVAGVVVSFFLAAQFLTSVRAAVATLLLLLFPGYLAYATSFMTDVPALAAELGCLGLGAIALRHRPIRVKWLVASAVTGCFAFSIREFGIAAPASVMLCAILVEPRRWQHWVLTLAVVCCVGILYFVKATLPNQVLGGGVGVVPETLFPLVGQLPFALASTALALLPAALIGAVWWRHTCKRVDVAIGAALGLVVVGITLVSWFRDGAMPMVRLENLASPLGAAGGGYIIGARPLLVSEAGWHAMDVLALVATVVVLAVGAGLVGAGLRQGGKSVREVLGRLGSPLGLLVVFSSVVTIGLAVYGLRWPLYDRYLWPLIVPIAILLLHRPQRGPSQASSRDTEGRAILQVATAVLSLFSIIAILFMLNSFAFDSGRWRAGERLVQLGFAPDEVDAGYEWVGFHSSSFPGPSPTGGGATFYETWWSARRTCAIATGTVGREILLGKVEYSLYLIAGPTQSLYLYGAKGSGCGPI